MRTNSRLAGVAVIALASTVAFTGCEAKKDEQPPKASGSEPAAVASIDDVVAAFDALGDTNAMAVTISTDVDDAVLTKMMEGESAQSQHAMRGLLDGSFTYKVVYPDGTVLSELPAESLDPWAADIQFTAATSANLVDVVYADETLYAAVGMDAISDLAGTDVEKQVQPMLTGPFQTVGQALIDGKYLSVNRATLEKLNDQIKQMAPEAQAAEGLDPAVSKKLMDGIVAALEKNSEVADGGDGYTTVTADTRGLLTEVRTILAEQPEFADQIADFTQADIDKAATEVPKVSIDILIVDGEATEVRFDLAQFADAADKAKMKIGAEDGFELVMTFDDEATIDVPTDVVPADDVVNQLLTGMGGQPVPMP